MPATLQEEIDIIHFRLRQIQEDLGLDKFKIPLEQLSDLAGCLLRVLHDTDVLAGFRQGRTLQSNRGVQPPGAPLWTRS